MKNLPGIRIFSFVSLDGFICGPDGGMEWLTGCIPYTGEEYGFAEFRSGAGCVLMGGMYYAALQASDFWPFGDRRCFVVAPHHMGSEQGKNIEYIIAGHDEDDLLIERIKEIGQQTEGYIWLAGDGRLAALLMDREMIDELIINIVPVTLRSGCRPVGMNGNKSRWTLTGCRKFDGGIIQLAYKRKSSIPDGRKLKE